MRIERGRSSAAATSRVIFVEDDDASGFALRQVKGDGSAHDTSAEDDEVGGLVAMGARCRLCSCGGVLEAAFFPVSNYSLRCVVAGGPGDATAGMRASAAEVEAIDRACGIATIRAQGA